MSYQKLMYSTPSNTTKKDNHLDALLALRGLACLMVVIFHCASPRNSIVYKGYDLSWLTFSHGYVAVWIFFCLSGYLMGKAFYTERYAANISGVINFWRNRVLRICPLYYFSILIFSIFVYPEVLKLTNWGYIVRLCTFTYHYDIDLPVSFNGALWSISTEMQFYILVPFIYNFFRYRLVTRRQVILTVLFIIFVNFVLRCIPWFSFRSQITEQGPYVVKYWYTPVITNLDLFLCGFLVNIFIMYSKSKPEQIEFTPNPFKSTTFLGLPMKKFVAVILVILLYLFTAHHLYHQELYRFPDGSDGWRTSTTFFILQPLTAIITSFFIYAFESESYHEFLKNDKLSFTSILKNPLRILEVFGIFSYGLYIWHGAISDKVYSVFTSKIPIEAFYSRLTAVMMLSLLVAIVTYYLVELPATKLKLYQHKDKAFYERHNSGI